MKQSSNSSVLFQWEGTPPIAEITKRITSEVPGINRVLYDLTPKPTGTIEYE